MRACVHGTIRGCVAVVGGVAYVRARARGGRHRDWHRHRRVEGNERERETGGLGRQGRRAASHAARQESTGAAGDGGGVRLVAIILCTGLTLPLFARLGTESILAYQLDKFDTGEKMNGVGTYSLIIIRRIILEFFFKTMEP